MFALDQIKVICLLAEVEEKWLLQVLPKRSLLSRLLFLCQNP